MADKGDEYKKTGKGAEAVPDAKATVGKKKAGVAAPPVGEELLSLLEYVSEIDKSSALRELKISGETLDQWVDELSKDEWIWVADRDLGEYYVGLTDKSRGMIDQLKELKKEEESMVGEKPVKKKISIRKILYTLTGVIMAVIKSILHVLHSNIVDLSILAGIVTLAYLLYHFFMDPNRFILNFLASVVLFSQILFTYRWSRKKLKTTTIMEDLTGLYKVITLNWKGAVFFVFTLLLIYFAGWALLFPQFRAVSILVCTLLVSFIIQLYYPLKPISKVPRFYFGMLMLVYSMLLILGTTKITPLVLEYESRFVDAAVGIAILAVVYIKRDFFGIQTDYFNRILSQEDE